MAKAGCTPRMLVPVAQTSAAWLPPTPREGLALSALRKHCGACEGRVMEVAQLPELQCVSEVIITRESFQYSL